MVILASKKDDKNVSNSPSFQSLEIPQTAWYTPLYLAVAMEDQSPFSPPDVSARSKPKKLQQKPLGLYYHPGENAVPCGRGRVYSSSTGNRYLKALVNHLSVPYSMTRTKSEKSQIITAIIDAIHAIPGGIFIRFQMGQWWEVDDAFAREKVGSLFRDNLFTKYRSSTKAKMAKKKEAMNDRWGEWPRSLSPDHWSLSQPSVEDFVLVAQDNLISQEEEVSPSNRFAQSCSSCGNISTQVSLDYHGDSASEEQQSHNIEVEEKELNYECSSDLITPPQSLSTFEGGVSPTLKRTTMTKVPRQVSASPTTMDKTMTSRNKAELSSPKYFEKPQIADDLTLEIEDELDSFLQDCF